MKFKVLLFSLLLLIVTFKSNGQKGSIRDLDTSVNNFIADLKTKGVDTILIYNYNNFIGGLVKFEDLCYVEPTYILWIENGKELLSKMDYCFDYSMIEMKKEYLWSYILKQFNYIKNERVKQFEYIKRIEGKEEKYAMARDHTGIQQFNLTINKDTVSQELDAFYLQEKENIHGEIVYNINFDYNKKLISTELVNMLSNLIDKVEKEKLLTKTKR